MNLTLQNRLLPYNGKKTTKSGLYPVFLSLMVFEMAFPAVFCDMDDLVRRSGTPVSSICDPDTKRHAVYFPPNIDLAAQIRMQELAQEDEADDTSSFMFRAPCSVKREDKEKETLRLNIVTPAQEIINRYRAGLRCDTEEISSTPSSSSPSSTTSGETTTCTEDDEQEPRTPESNCGLTVPKIRFRQSRFDALNEMRAEALREMKESGVSQDHPLVCPRPGCRETLSNVHALTFHLHLHDIDRTKSYECNKCNASFKTRRERKGHLCGKVGCKSAPTSPLCATFGTILSRITSLN